MGSLLVIALGLPLLACGVSLVGRPLLAEAAAALAALAALGLAVALALHVRHGDSVHVLHGWLRLDSLGAVFLLTTGLVYAAAAIFSVGYLRADERRRDYRPFARRYFAYLNLFAWTMVLVPIAADFATLWIAVELTTIVSALLVALDRTDAALEAAWKYVLIASAGLGIALIAVILLYGAGTGPLGSEYLPASDATSTSPASFRRPR